MHKISGSLIGSDFYRCPYPITQKIILESLNPHTREVCKIFKELFDKGCLNFIIKNLDPYSIKDLTIKELLIAKMYMLPNSNGFIKLKNFCYGIRNHSPKSVEISQPFIEDSDSYLSTDQKNFNYILEYEATSNDDKKIKLCDIITELRQGVEDTNLIQMCFSEDGQNWIYSFGIDTIHIPEGTSPWEPKSVEKIAFVHDKNDFI